ncbi:MAG: hypothetical protein VB877_00385 [Pirellulaceae bacterium]
MISSILWITLSVVVAGEPESPCLVLVTGAAGTAEYASQFDQWATRWQAAAQKAGLQFKRIGASKTATDDRQQLQDYLKQISQKSASPLWIVLIGHGTYAAKQAKFNLHGPDITATELNAWLKPLQRPIAIINCASSSGPFINRLSGKNRVIVTATNSGFENNYAGLGQYLSETISDTAADLDKDGQVSLLEAFILASGRVDEFYRQNGRLATEHGLVDDNGDTLGTPANWFRGVIGQKKAKGANQLDGLRANQFHIIVSDEEKTLTVELRNRRNDLERQLTELREKKNEFAEEDYFHSLENICLELARIYQQVETKPGKGS